MPPPLKYDYPALRAQFVAADPPISLSELCRLNGIPQTSASTVTRRAREEDWPALREKRLAKTVDRVITEIGEREANRILRRMQVEDNGIDAVDEAITKMRADMKRTKEEWTKNPETGEWSMREVPAVTYRPEQVVQLMDRIKTLFSTAEPAAQGDPSLAASFNFNFDGDNPEHRALAAQLVAETRGAGRPGHGATGSPLPTAPGAGEDQ